MKFSISADNFDLIKAGQEILSLFFPGFELVSGENEAGLNIHLSTGIVEAKVKVRAQLTQGARLYTEEKSEPLTDRAEAHNQAKRLVRLALLGVLETFSGRLAGPWGILTGIRPAKIVQRLLDADYKGQYIVSHLREGYGLSAEKAGLLNEIANRERSYLLTKEQAKRVIGIYIGIPFCPTRCAYCSFPAYSLEKWGYLVDDFLRALHQEIVALGQLIQELDLEVETIYIGGGTPTSLNSSQLQNLLETVRCNLLQRTTKEFTVEAGRPDTINREKLLVMKTAGVSRLSINPQSMVEETLNTIGRAHTSQEVFGAVEKAREVGFDFINMDIIIGLPGENSASLELTFKALEQLKPENLTVHTLAVKRASGLKENRAAYDLPSAEEGAKMLAETYEFAGKVLGMHPYYLYRQKQMISPLENVGFAREGFDCLYNIQMIEERQTILGLGAGAASKFVRPEDWTLKSSYNPKDPLNYVERIEELVARKVDNFRALS